MASEAERVAPAPRARSQTRLILGVLLAGLACAAYASAVNWFDAWWVGDYSARASVEELLRGSLVVIIPAGIGGMLWMRHVNSFHATRRGASWTTIGALGWISALARSISRHVFIPTHHRMHFAWKALPVALLLTQAACGSRGPAGMDALTLGPEHSSRTCPGAPTPAEIPPAAALLSLNQLASALEASSPNASGALLISVRFGGNGELAGLHVLEGDLDGADTDKALSAVREATIGSAAYANSTMRIRLARQDSLSVQVGRSELCPPRLVSAPPLAFQASMPSSQVSSVGTPRFRLLVDEQGRVIQQQLVESSGLSHLDAAASRRASQAKYEPARLDGQAVRAWVEMPER